MSSNVELGSSGAQDIPPASDATDALRDWESTAIPVDDEESTPLTSQMLGVNQLASSGSKKSDEIKAFHNPSWTSRLSSSFSKLWNTKDSKSVSKFRNSATIVSVLSAIGAPLLVGFLVTNPVGWIFGSIGIAIGAGLALNTAAKLYSKNQNTTKSAIKDMKKALNDIENHDPNTLAGAKAIEKNFQTLLKSRTKYGNLVIKNNQGEKYEFTNNSWTTIPRDADPDVKQDILLSVLNKIVGDKLDNLLPDYSPKMRQMYFDDS